MRLSLIAGGLYVITHKVLYTLISGLAISIVFHQTAAAAVNAPVLKWQYGGCYNSWCEKGWRSSPTVADIDGDGLLDVVASAYSIVTLKGTTGEMLWRVKSGHDISESGVDDVGRTMPPIVIQDVNDDGSDEIISAHGGGYVSVYNLAGEFLPGWPKRPLTSELRGLMVVDIDNDNTAEIIVSAAVGSKVNTWVYEHNGVVRSGWPQLANDSGYAYGIFNDNVAAADLDKDGLIEIIAPSDVHYICAYKPNGVQLPTHAMYGDKAWGKVGIWEDLTVELRGWGQCNGVRSESYRTNFAHGAAVVADVNNDQSPEVVVTGNVYNCDVGHPPGKYTGVYIFNPDRSRFNSDGFDWNTLPIDTGAPLSEDYNEIESARSNPVVTDLDGDGKKEILFASYDGRLHAYWLDKTEHHNWPFSVYNASEGVIRFASEPVVADLDNDGDAEVLFSSWPAKGSYQNGKLHVLDYRGSVLHEIPLPDPRGTRDWNGAMAAPTLANIDQDADLELIINTVYSGVVTYDLPGTAQARVLWKTGRDGRIWQPKVLTPAEKLQAAVKLLQVLSGTLHSGEDLDPDNSGRSDMSDVLLYLHQAADAD